MLEMLNITPVKNHFSCSELAILDKLIVREFGGIGFR